jgi:hypothetical protein
MEKRVMPGKQLKTWSIYRSLCGFAGLVALAVGCNSQMDLGPVGNARVASEIRTSLGGSEAAGDASASSASTGTGWATLRGRFIFDGAPPDMSPYNVTKDQAVCTIGGKPPLQETLVVDSGNHGIRGVAIYLRDASRVNDSAKPTGEPIVFDQKECLFLSHVCGVIVGQTLEIKNSDPVGHNTNISGKNRFNQTIPAHDSIAFKVQKEEALPALVNCSIHPWMVAHLLPRENGYFSVTAPDGTFELANLPAGEPLELQVWHESAAGPGGSLVLNTPQGKELKWTNKGRFTITLEPDEVKEVEIKVPPSAFRG